jgi:hypothetical protein
MRELRRNQIPIFFLLKKLKNWHEPYHVFVGFPGLLTGSRSV